LSGQKVCVTICQNCEVVSFHVQERENGIFPSVNKKEFEVLLGSITVYSIGRVNNSEEDVVEEGLESRDRSSFVDEEGRKSIGPSDAQGKDLPIIS